ncbi:hypothetical protein HAX54_052218 [Datura stramonium]|uniref:Disease resistance protein winged helix domain-containing protein n=1 Tax=Datura stramonium TaxID=4076 RepID=A0ABS8SZA8_DATST|nr:hypothetical protein [Datura stramonium]
MGGIGKTTLARKTSLPQIRASFHKMAENISKFHKDIYRRLDKSSEEVAVDYLEELISRNLIMVRKRRFNGEIKACGMHDLMREFCLKEANATNFMHVERTHGLVHTLPEQDNNVRRFSLQPQYSYVANNCCDQLPTVARSIYSLRLLEKTEALKIFKTSYASQYPIKRFFLPTSSLKRLSFSGCEFPWEDISTLVMLPNLEELKLKEHAVIGTEWILSDEKQFSKACTTVEDSARNIEQEQEDIGNNCKESTSITGAGIEAYF